MKLINILIMSFNTVLKYIKHLDMHDNIESTKIASDNRFILRCGKKTN